MPVALPSRARAYESPLSNSSVPNAFGTNACSCRVRDTTSPPVHGRPLALRTTYFADHPNRRESCWDIGAPPSTKYPATEMPGPAVLACMVDEALLTTRPPSWRRGPRAARTLACRLSVELRLETPAAGRTRPPTPTFELSDRVPA